MRISDWSSDVCSSDLFDHRRRVVVNALPEQDDAIGGRRRLGKQVDCGEDHILPCRGQFMQNPAKQQQGIGLDRKSVVSGKSVSVRVCTGSRRLVTQKKYKYRRLQ